MTERDRKNNRERELDKATMNAITGDSTSASNPAEDGAGGALEDLSAVQADDALLDALGGSDPKIADELGDQELNALLLAWRRDIDSQPLAELVDTDTAVTTVKTAALARQSGPKVRKRRMLVPVAAAAAVLAIAFTGTGIAARDAQPGDTLWGLSKVLYADHARSIEAASSVQLDLQTASTAIANGKWEEARKALDAARSSLAAVAAEDDLQRLKEQHKVLLARLDPAAVPPQQQDPGQQVPPPQQQVPQPNPSDQTSNPMPSTPLPTQPSDEPTHSDDPPPSSSDPTDSSSSTPSSSPSTSPQDSTTPDTGGRFDSSNATPSN